MSLKKPSVSNPESKITRCKTCRQDIATEKMFLHEGFCQRNNVFCEHCEKVFLKNDYDEHLKDLRNSINSSKSTAIDENEPIPVVNVIPVIKQSITTTINPNTIYEYVEMPFTEEYKVGGSTIEIKGTKIIINLTLDIPKVETALNEDVVLGVDLGQAVPAMCALNNDYYKRLAIGSADEFLRIRTQIQNERRRLQHALKDSRGGHGRQKKLRALDRLKEREKNFVQTYSHMVSRRVVDFAIKNGAKYINIEDLSGFGRDKYGHVKDDEHSKMILRNWSYYDLQEKIKYKAAIHGIEVRKIDPKYTSQTCSVCGERGLRQTQKEFICINPECARHKIYNNQKYINADFNAARNIAMSQNFIEEDEGSKKKNGQKKENSSNN